MRVGIALSDPTFESVLRRAVRTAGHEVIWCESDAGFALRRTRDDTPDVVLVDLVVTRRWGSMMEFVRSIVHEMACPVLALMPMTETESDIARVFEATGAGARDVVPANIEGETLRIDASVLAARLRNVRSSVARRQDATRNEKGVRDDGPPLVVIGASAGGPQALGNLLGQFRPDFPGSIILVQHISDVFSARMADWLASVSNLPLRLAIEGDRPQRGAVLMAAGSSHLRLTPECNLEYAEAPRNIVYRPSIDFFFDSVVQHWRGRAIGVLLTGMGRDGAVGLARMRARGFITIAQDQASSAVFGMPKAAAALDAAVEVLPLDSIGKRIVELVS